MDKYKLFSKELSICYFMQNEGMTEEKMMDAFSEDETIIQGELMGMLMDADDLGELGDEDEE